MLMMTNNMLCAVEQRLKQSTLITDTFSFLNKLLIFVEDLAQLPAICIHKPKVPDIIWKTYHITYVPYWAAAKHHKLQTSIIHSSVPLSLISLT